MNCGKCASWAYGLHKTHMFNAHFIGSNDTHFFAHLNSKSLKQLMTHVILRRTAGFYMQPRVTLEMNLNKNDIWLRN